MKRDSKSVFACLSARVGSIEHNQLGGWYGYRASKAALNMMIKTLSIELARSNPRSVCVGLHPGTVDTRLSKPFQGNVGSEKLFAPKKSALALLSVVDNLTPTDTGKIFAWDGEVIPY
jgi:NAD(P)-dependent dehydrogenase (short-subunit alcohol dehydrogenase family)